MLAGVRCATLPLVRQARQIQTIAAQLRYARVSSSRARTRPPTPRCLMAHAGGSEGEQAQAPPVFVYGSLQSGVQARDSFCACGDWRHRQRYTLTPSVTTSQPPTAAEEVLQILIGRVPAMKTATLPGHKRFSLKGRSYPGVVPAESSTVKGKLLLDLTARDRALLDEFEACALPAAVAALLGEEYELRAVEVADEDGKELLRANAYIFCDRSDLLYGTWDYEAWRADHLQDFMTTCRSFMKLLADRGWQQPSG